MTLLDTAIPPPDVGPLIAQHKIAEVDNHRRGAQSWQVAERVQDNVVRGPLGDRSVVQASRVLPYGPAEGLTATCLPAFLARQRPDPRRFRSSSSCAFL